MKIPASIVVLIAVVLQSCVTVGLQPQQPPSTSPARQMSRTNQLPQIPFSLQLYDEINDGQVLHIRGGITAQTSWKVSEVVLRLSGMYNGQPSRVSFHELSELLELLGDEEQDKLIRTSGVDELVIVPDQEVMFSLSIPVEGISDYQLELLWGKVAASYAASKNNTSAGRLAIQDVKVAAEESECSTPPCGLVYRIEGNLINTGSAVVEKAVLGVGFVWQASDHQLDLKRVVPENEEAIVLSGLALQPGDVQPIRLAVDRSVPSFEGGEYTPVVRVISAPEQGSG